MRDIFSITNEWNKLANREGVSYILTVSPGLDNRYDYRYLGPKVPVVIRERGAFKELLNFSLYKNSKIIFITSFNEWFEYTSIEPSRNYGFEYLKILKETIYNKNSNG